MLIATNPPPYTLPQGEPRSYILQGTMHGPQIIHNRRHRTNPAPWPAGSYLDGNQEHPVLSNRRFRSMLFTAWLRVLSPTNRANWETTAHSQTIRNHYGALKTPNGFELYVWFHCANRILWSRPPDPFTPDTSLIVKNPPSPFVKATAPVLDTLFRVFDSELDYYLTLDRAWSGWSANWQISNLAATRARTNTAHFQYIPGSIRFNIRPRGKWSANAPWQNLLEIPPGPGLRILRLQVLPPSPPQVPSDWITFNYDLSITYP